MDVAIEGFDCRLNVSIMVQLGANLLYSMLNCGVITVSKYSPDFGKRSAVYICESGTLRRGVVEPVV